MTKVAFWKILFYWLIKYIVFYVFMMFKNKDYYLINPGIRNGEDLVYYLWIFLSLPIICSLLFSVPIYLSFRSKKMVYIVLSLLLIVIAEYFVYTYMASQTDRFNGLYNALISIVIFILFFFSSSALVRVTRNNK
jgi:hypothetical protein